MNRPIMLGQKLSLGLVASVDIPELREENQASERLNAARVDGKRVCFRRARPVIRNQDTSVVVFALARVELCRDRSGRCCGHNGSSLHDASHSMVKERNTSRREVGITNGYNILEELA